MEERPDVGQLLGVLDRHMLTEIERTDEAAWCRFRAPDGTVLEIVGPAGA